MPNYFKFYKKKNLSFNITHIKYSFESNNITIKIEYFISFYDENNILIAPSDITLFNKIHILCNSKEINSHINIISLANIYENKCFKCTEFFNKNEEIIFGIKIYIIENDVKFKTINFITQKNNKFDNLIINYTFYCSRIIEEYNNLINYFYNNENIQNNLKLKKTYLKKPICTLKKSIPLKRKSWIFSNIYNHYFCFCKGLHCLYENIPQFCKYYFYLSIIDNNKNIYNKTDYLFGDFIYKRYSSDDAYPIFEEMINQKLPAHYVTENRKIYMKYCNFSEKCSKIILIAKEDKYVINGDF